MSGFTNAITDGAGTLVVPSIQSPNFVPGVSGWIVRKDGTAEFEDVTARGDIIATDLILPVVAALADPGSIRWDDAQLKPGAIGEVNPADPVLMIRGPSTQPLNAATILLNRNTAPAGNAGVTMAVGGGNIEADIRHDGVLGVQVMNVGHNLTAAENALGITDDDGMGNDRLYLTERGIEIYRGTPGVLVAFLRYDGAKVSGDLDVTGQLTGGMTGEMRGWGGAVPPAGWLFCDGSSLLRAGTYAALFAVIGTSWGAIDGLHFTLPNLVNRVWRGNGRGIGAGADTHDHAFSEAAPHVHTSAAHNHPLSSNGFAHVNTQAAPASIQIERAAHAFAANASQAVTGAGVNAAQANAAILGGTTDSRTPANTGGHTVAGTTGDSSNIPAYTEIPLIIKT